MKRPSKKSISMLRLALGMTGNITINNATAELILVTQAEMERLGGEFSLRDAAKIEAFVTKNNTPEPPKV